MDRQVNKFSQRPEGEQAVSASTVRKHEETGRPSHPGGSIIVVDENPALQKTARAILESTGFRGISCTDTISALCAIVDHEPVAVLVDSMVGPLDAWQFSLLVKGHPQFSNIRVIVLGKQQGILEQARANAAGADDFLQKPFSSDDIRVLLGAGMEQRI